MARDAISESKRPACRTEPDGSRMNDAAGKYLTFFLADEEYGLEILAVQEIIEMMPITPVPGTPDEMCGVINLRGKVIPIVDLRVKFGMEPSEPTPETCIIVVNAGHVEMGVVVDRVSEVLDIDRDEVEDPPSFMESLRTDFIRAIGKTEDRVRLLLDIERVLSVSEGASVAIVTRGEEPTDAGRD